MRSQSGLTLIELMVVVVVVAILASIALPSYQNYVTKSRAQAAAADLGALAAAVESRFQRTLSYPTTGATGTSNVKTAFPQWNPSGDDFFNFNYNPGAPYSLEAEGKGAMSGCDLELSGDNSTRSATADCKIGASW